MLLLRNPCKTLQLYIAHIKVSVKEANDFIYEKHIV